MDFKQEKTFMEQPNETNPIVADSVVADDDKSKLNFSPEQQKLFDAKISEITRKAYERAEKKANDKLKAMEEAERLKNMSESEKQAEQIKQYEAKIAEYEQRDLKNQFKVELSAAGLPQDYADYIPVSNADKAKEAITFLKNFKDSIVNDYEKRIKELESQLKSAQMRTPAPKAPGRVVGSKASPQFQSIFEQLKNNKS